MTEEQIKHMAQRFLSWRLPEDFHPDAGISFKAAYNEHTPWPAKHEPVGTNLFDAGQADAMVRYMVEGLPKLRPYPFTEEDCPAHVGTPGNTKVCERCGVHVDAMR